MVKEVGMLDIGGKTWVYEIEGVKSGHVRYKGLRLGIWDIEVVKKIEYKKTQSWKNLLHTLCNLLHISSTMFFVTIMVPSLNITSISYP